MFLGLIFSGMILKLLVRLHDELTSLQGENLCIIG
jgi:hypothetical protein